MKDKFRMGPHKADIKVLLESVWPWSFAWQKKFAGCHE